MPIILNGTTGITTPGITNTGPFTFQGVVELPAGAVGAPSLTTTGDTNTGIYFPAADTIGFVEGGVEALRINSSAQIAVNTAGTAGAPVITKTDDLNTGIFFPAADTIAFSEGGVEALRIDSSANVGIGTSSPASILHAQGTSAQFNLIAPTGNPSIRIGDSATSGTRKEFTITVDNTNNRVEMQAIQQGVGTRDIVINPAGGNLGIGTSSPASGFRTTIEGTNQLRLRNTTTRYRSDFTVGSGGLLINAYDDTGGVYLEAALDGNPVSFRTNGTERARITSAGAMGIGTSNPQARLEVNTASGADAYALAAWPFLKWDNSNELSYGGYTASQWQVLKFFTGGFERARIKSVGYSMFSNNGAYADSTYHEFSQSQGNWILHLRNISSTGTLGVPIVYSNAAPNNTANEFLYCVDSFINRAVIRSNGGLANFQANDVNLSDQRVKKDVKPLGSMWDKFKAIEIVTFKYKDQTHDDDNIGVIAQQVESVAPEFIDNDGWGEKLPEDGVPLKTVYTTDMYHAAIKALQEAMARIEVLEADMAVMKGSN